MKPTNTDLEQMTAEQRIEAALAWQREMREKFPIPEPARSDPLAHRIAGTIPKRHREGTLESYRPRNEPQAAALKAAREWCARVVSGDGPALALTGAVGTGKSHLLYAAVRDVLGRGVRVAAYGWYELSLLLRDAKFARDEEAWKQAREERERIFDAGVLAIDEIRPTASTDFDATELSQLMTRAHRECQAVIVTSNYADRKLAEIIGLAATDRLTQVQLIGESYRHHRLRAI